MYTQNHIGIEVLGEYFVKTARLYCRFYAIRIAFWSFYRIQLCGGKANIMKNFKLLTKSHNKNSTLKTWFFERKKKGFLPL